MCWREHAGVRVEVVAPPPAAAPRIAAAEDGGPLSLFHLYADHVAMSPDAVSAGVAILRVRPHITVAVSEPELATIATVLP